MILLFLVWAKHCEYATLLTKIPGGRYRYAIRTEIAILGGVIAYRQCNTVDILFTNDLRLLTVVVASYLSYGAKKSS